MSEWMPIESAPVDERILATLMVRHRKTDQCWWETNVIFIDSDTGEISSDTDAGWSAGDYTHWMPLPPPPAQPASAEGVGS